MKKLLTIPALFICIYLTAQSTPVTNRQNPAVTTQPVGTVERAITNGPDVVRPANYSPTKSACLTVFFFNDNLFTSLVQNAQVNLQHCIDGYDKSVLLKEDMNSVGQTRPTVLKKPNKEVFLSQIKELANDGYWIDIRVFTHGFTESIPFANDKYLTASELESELSKSGSGYSQLPIRSVYQMNCYGHTFNQVWLRLGAKVVSGARYVNFYPNQFNKFASEWAKGNVSYTNALQESNTESSRTLMQTAIQADAAKDIFPKNWDKCPIGSSILGDRPCAKSYFTTFWQSTDEWQNNQSGKDNMNYSSYMFRVGETGLTANNRSLLVWTR